MSGHPKKVAYKSIIDAALTDHIAQINEMSAQYGLFAKQCVAYFNELLQNGKRIRGSLAMAGYRMGGGKDDTVAVQAACVIEIIHAHILMLDDVMDDSPLRYGKSTAVRRLTHDIFKNSDAAHKHAAESAAQCIAYIAFNYGLSCVLGLSVASDHTMNALQVLHKNLMTTGYGQLYDVTGSVMGQHGEFDSQKVNELKTAYYSFLLPLQFGLALAGKKSTPGIHAYATAMGNALQLSDDIQGLFATKEQTGKDPTDDIRQGTRTVLLETALQHATKTDIAFLKKIAGSPTISDEQLKTVRAIYMRTKAYSAVQEQQQHYINQANDAVVLLAKTYTPRQLEPLRQVIELLQMKND